MDKEELEDATDNQLQEWLNEQQIALAYDVGGGWNYYEREIKQIQEEINRRKDGNNG